MEGVSNVASDFKDFPVGTLTSEPLEQIAIIDSRSARDATGILLAGVRRPVLL